MELVNAKPTPLSVHVKLWNTNGIQMFLTEAVVSHARQTAHTVTLSSSGVALYSAVIISVSRSKVDTHTCLRGCSKEQTLESRTGPPPSDDFLLLGFFSFLFSLRCFSFF